MSLSTQITQKKQGKSQNIITMEQKVSEYLSTKIVPVFFIDRIISAIYDKITIKMNKNNSHYAKNLFSKKIWKNAQKLVHKRKLVCTVNIGI